VRTLDTSNGRGKKASFSSEFKLELTWDLKYLTWFINFLPRIREGSTESFEKTEKKRFLGGISEEVPEYTEKG